MSGPAQRAPRAARIGTRARRRFYTTDFDEMERMFSLKDNPDLPMAELECMLAEFKQDYNQRHFVRNETFKVRACARVVLSRA